MKYLISLSTFVLDEDVYTCLAQMQLFDQVQCKWNTMTFACCFSVRSITMFPRLPPAYMHIYIVYVYRKLGLLSTPLL